MNESHLDEAAACANQAITGPHGDDVDALADGLLAVIRHLRSASSPVSATEVSGGTGEGPF